MSGNRRASRRRRARANPRTTTRPVAPVVNSVTIAQTPHISQSPKQVLQTLLGCDDRAAAYAAAIGAALVLFVGIPLSAAINIWIDEAFTLHSTGAGIGYALNQAGVFEAQPPLYFLIEAAWRTLNESSIAFARVPSIVFAAAAVAAIVGAAHRLLPRISPLAVALITAGNQLTIWAATEMRVYALVFLIGTLLVWTFCESFFADRPNRFALGCYVVVAILGLYTQYYVGFMLVSQGVTVLLFGRRALLRFCVSMIVVGLAFVPFVQTVIFQVRSSGGFVAHQSLLHAVHEILNDVFAYVLPHEIDWSGPAKYIGFLLAAAVLIALLVDGRPVIRTASQRAVLLQLGVCLGIFAVVFYAAGMPALVGRHMIVVAPSCLLAACIVVSSLTRRRRLLSVIAVATFAIFSGAMFAVQYRPPLAKAGDWRRVAQAVSTADDTPVAVFPPEIGLPLETYTAHSLVSIPRPLAFRADYVQASTLRGESDVARVLDPIRAHTAGLWVVTDGPCIAAKLDVYDYHCAYLESYLNHWYRPEQVIPFRGALVRRYVRIASG